MRSGWLTCLIENSPIVILKRADLHETEQALLAVDLEIAVLGLSARNGDFLDGLTHALHGVALEETLTTDAVWAPHQTDRPLDEVRKHERGDNVVILGDVELGDAGAGVVNLIGIA